MDMIDQHGGAARTDARRPAIPLQLESIKSLTKTIEPAFLRRLACAAGGFGTFIETGTFYGQTTQAAAEIFDAVHTIELSTELCQRAVQLFAGNHRVQVHQGESADVLARILPDIEQPALFWLNAHYSEANTACGRENTPIIAELEALRAAGVRDALILIDDLRCFQPERVDTRQSLRGYPTISRIQALVREIDPQAGFTVLGDVAIASIGAIRIAPSALLQACTESRCYMDGANLPAVLAAEQIIAASANPERTALIALAEEYQASERFGLGGHYRLWRGLAYQHEGQVAHAREDFTAALGLGCDHARVRAYLAEAQSTPSASATSMDTTGEDRAIKRCIHPGAVVFDVGANIGDWTRAALAHSGDIEVHLFEASPITYQRLHATLKPSNSSRCIFNQMALGNQRGYKAFHHYTDAPAWSTFYRRIEAEQLYGKRPPVEIQVPVETLDSYAALHGLKHIDYLKIDVEGAEYDVISGATQLLRVGAIDYIQFEYGGTYNDAAITLRLVYALLRRFGYAVFKIEADDFVPINEFSDSMEDYNYSNFLAVNERLITLFTGGKPRMFDLTILLDKHGIAPRGVIHIGAHEGREANTYAAMGMDTMLFVEANPAVYRTLENNLQNHPQARAFNVAMSDLDGMATLHVTSMDQSSSILPLGQHSDIYPSIVETDTIEVTARTLDSLLSDNDIDARNYNILNLDIQGAELLALRGAEQTLTHIDAINTEINYAELYRGGAHIDALDDFLNVHGFTRVATTTPFHPTWGDALYIRKPTLSMSTLGNNGRFANQIFQYAFLKIRADEHGCRVSTPDWIGNRLFGAQDDLLDIDRPLPEMRQTLDQNLLTCAIANTEQPLRNVDLWGYFQYHTRYYAPYKGYFRSLFRPVDSLRRDLDSAIARLRAGGRTLVGLHLRRGDYGYRIFYLTPNEWYRRWLAEIWPTLENPLLYIASDDPDAVLTDFADYQPVTARDLGVTVPDAEFYPDFHVLSQCDHVAISNSSFSFAACMLNEQGRSFMRPDIKAGHLIPFDPWNSEPLQRDALAEDYGPPHERPGDLASPPARTSNDTAPIRPDDTWPPRISVYITSYNQKSWLQEAIDSVLAQTVMPHEIIIVDDASEDGSQALIEQYKELHPNLIKPIFHRQNLGIARSRIDALNSVTGDYVTYVDGDDRFMPEKLEHELATLAANPGVELVYSNFYFIDAEGARTALWAEDNDVVYTGWIFPYVFAREFPKRTLFRNELVAHAALRRAGFHDPNLELFEDFDLRIRLTVGLQAAYCDRPLAEYRRHGGSLSHADLRGQMAALDYIYTKNAALLPMLATDIREHVTQAYQEWVTRSYLSRVENELAAAENAQEQDDLGGNLIFLLASPWSGASLLQQVLGRHAQIQPVDEAGILLPLIDILNTPEHSGAQGLRTFIDSLPDGEASYLQCARRFAGELYGQAIARSGKRICLDRTSDYVAHIADIRRLLPKARFVMLLRHPGAALETAISAHSAETADTHGDDILLDDLISQPAHLLQGLAELGTDSVVVRYEDLVSQPKLALRRLCARLGLRVDQAMLDSIEQFSQMELSRDGIQSDAWMGRIVSSGNGPAACDYLEALGVDTLEGLGYAYAATLEKLAAVQSPTGVNIQEQARAIVEDGEYRFAQGDLISAENLFRAALDQDAGNTDALNNLGVLHWQQGETDRALEYLVQGLGIAPYDRSLVTNTVTVLHALNKHADAISLCRTYLEYHSDDDGLRTQLDMLEADQNMQNGYRQAVE